jgi:haloacetate dehalogenase
MFDGFRLDRVDVGEVTLRVRYGGAGEPVVLLHGHPRTHTTWHRVAPQLSGSFFVVCPDLRGYGQSTLPPDAPGQAQSSKRAMAGDVVALMRHLGHYRFWVVDMTGARWWPSARPWITRTPCSGSWSWMACPSSSTSSA